MLKSPLSPNENRDFFDKLKSGSSVSVGWAAFCILYRKYGKTARYGKYLSRADSPRSVAPEGLNGVEIRRFDRREKAEHNADAHGKHHGDEDRRDADGRRRAHDG